MACINPSQNRSIRECKDRITEKDTYGPVHLEEQKCYKIFIFSINVFFLSNLLMFSLF